MALFLKNDEWYIDYYANGRRKREKIGPNKTLALNVLRKRKVEIAENKFLDIQKQEKIKFEDFAHIYLENHCKINNKGWKNADWVYLNPKNKKSLVGYFGGRYLHEITPFMIEQFKRERREEVAPATINRMLQILSSLYSRAIDWGKAKENPMKKVKLFKLDNQRLRYLEKLEIQALLDASSPKLKAIITVALNTGMRRGEIENLKWQEIDLVRNTICILKQKNGDKSYIPINEPTRQVLISIRHVIDSPYVFCKNNGQPYSFRKSFETALKKSGILNASFHTLRHTFASHLAMSGIDLNTIRELMRHKSLAMTQRYAHLSKDHKAKAVSVLACQMDIIWTPDFSVNDDDEFNKIVSQIEIDTNKV